MERRQAVIAAATASLTLLAGAAAISLNTGIVSASGDDGAGHISPVVATTPPTTVYVDQPAGADQTTASTGSTRHAPSASAAGVPGDDDRYGDEGEHEGEGTRLAGDAHTEVEYEGADDDD